MTKHLHLVYTLAFVFLFTQAEAQDNGTNSTLTVAEHSRAIKIGYDASHLANSLQYHQARTMLAGMGDYTRYDYSERITENNWFYSQIEELELQLPRMRRAAKRIQVSDEDQNQIDSLFEHLEALLAASRKVHSAIKDGNLDGANRLYHEIVDEPYNSAIAAAHTLISENDRAITMIRLKAK